MDSMQQSIEKRTGVRDLVYSNRYVVLPIVVIGMFIAVLAAAAMWELAIIASAPAECGDCCGACPEGSGGRSVPER